MRRSLWVWNFCGLLRVVWYAYWNVAQAVRQNWQALAFVSDNSVNASRNWLAEWTWRLTKKWILNRIDREYSNMQIEWSNGFSSLVVKITSAFKLRKLRGAASVAKSKHLLLEQRSSFHHGGGSRCFPILVFRMQPILLLSVHCFRVRLKPCPKLTGLRSACQVKGVF